MKNEIFYFNSPEYEAAVRGIQTARERFQSLLNEVRRLEHFDISSLEDLTDLANQGSQYLKNRISDMIPPPENLGPFRMRRGSIADLLELPDFTGIDSLTEKCREVADRARYLVLARDGSRVDIDELAMEKLRETYTVRAKDKTEQDALDAYREMVGALQRMRKIFLLMPSVQLKELVKIDIAAGTIEPRYSFFWEKRGYLAKHRGKG